MIKIIACDLGGVYFEAGTGIAMEKMYKIMNVPKKTIHEIFRASAKKEGWLLRKGKLTSDEFWKIAMKKLEIDENMVSTLREIWYSSYTPIPGMKELIQQLRKNHKVIAFSGNIDERIKYLDAKYGLLRDFDGFVLSFDAGYNKDEVEFYEILVEKIRELGFKPEECTFIDDLQEFLDTAATFGIRGILFKDVNQLKSDLKEHDVMV